MAFADVHFAVRLDTFQKPRVIAATGVFGRNAVVPEFADGQESGEVGGAAVVVHIEVGRDEVVDVVQTRRLGHHAMDATGVTITRHAAIHFNGLAGRRDEERAAAALHVHPVDVQRLVFRSREGGSGQSQQQAEGIGPFLQHCVPVSVSHGF